MSTTALKKTKLAMVDLDNTLVFTMNANFEAYKRALNERGIDLTPEHFPHTADGRFPLCIQKARAGPPCIVFQTYAHRYGRTPQHCIQSLLIYQLYAYHLH